MKRSTARLLLYSGFVACSGPPATAHATDLAIVGGTIHTASGGVIESGTVLMRDGKIVEVGRDVTVSDEAEVISADGLVVTPGIIDASSRIGLSRDDLWDRENLVSAARRAVDALQIPANSQWLQGGVTAVYVSPAPSNLVGGFGAVVKLAGEGADAIVREAAGMSVSFGESALNAFDAPTTRQGMIATLRQELIRTQEYMDRRENDPASRAIDPRYEAFANVIREGLPFRFYANTPDDILTALRLAREFSLRIVIDSAAGAHLVADALVAAEIQVVLGPSILGIGSGGPFELFAHSPRNAFRLHSAGVRIALSTESGTNWFLEELSGWGELTDRSVVLEGLVAKAHGLPEEAALRAITLDAAKILGVADRLGSIDPGKDADVVIWKNHPLSTWGETRRVIVDGKTVFERTRP